MSDHAFDPSDEWTVMFGVRWIREDVYREGIDRLTKERDDALENNGRAMVRAEEAEDRAERAEREVERLTNERDAFSALAGQYQREIGELRRVIHDLRGGDDR